MRAFVDDLADTKGLLLPWSFAEIHETGAAQSLGLPQWRPCAFESASCRWEDAALMAGPQVKGTISSSM